MISIFKKKRRNLFALACSAVFGTLLASFGAGDVFAASAANVGELTQNTADSIPIIVKLVSAISYVLGTGFVGLGVYKARDWSNSPQQTKPSEILKYLGAGGLLVAAPAAAHVLTQTIGVTSAVDATSTTYTTVVTDGSGGDIFTGLDGSLDEALVNFIRAIAQPMSNIVMGFAYLAGAILTVVGLVRLTKSAQEGPRGPSGLGTMGTFVAAAMLLSASQVMGAFTNTIFGTAPKTYVYAEVFGLGSVPTQQAENMLSAILGFMALVGTISFVRGIFVLRGFAEGNSQMTLMGGMSHIIAGVLAVNLGQFINIVETTLGVTLGSGSDFSIKFS